MWSLHIVGSKYALSNGFLPMPFLIIRFVSAALVFIAIALFVERTLRIEGRSDQLYVAGAAVMFAVNQIAFVYALKATTAVTVSLVFGLFPITVACSRRAIGHEAMTTQKAVAGFVSFVGVSLVVIGIPGGMSKLSGEIWGILIALCIPLSWAFFSLLIGPPMKRHTPMRINAVVLPGTALADLVVGFSSLGNQDYAKPDDARVDLPRLLRARHARDHEPALVPGRRPGRRRQVLLLPQPPTVRRRPPGVAPPGRDDHGDPGLGGIGIGAGIVISRVRVARRHHSSEGTTLAVGQETVTRPPRSKGVLVLLAKTSVPADSLTFQTTVPTNRAVVERLTPAPLSLAPRAAERSRTVITADPAGRALTALPAGVVKPIVVPVRLRTRRVGAGADAGVVSTTRGAVSRP